MLGWEIVRQASDGEIRLKIVETEAYHQDDPASHSFHGLTPRTKPMFEVAGTIYVYFTYGVHHCLNFVTGPKGVGEGVLIRAGEPVSGIDIMWRNRHFVRGRTSHKGVEELANGPGKLAQALGIKDTKLSGKILNKSSIFLEPPRLQINPSDIAISPRVGIRLAAEQPWRFYIKNSPFVSKVYSKAVHN